MNLVKKHINIDSMLIIKACKEVIRCAESTTEPPERYETAVYQLDCIMKDIRERNE